jgi:hypothetical protein
MTKRQAMLIQHWARKWQVKTFWNARSHFLVESVQRHRLKNSILSLIRGPPDSSAIANKAGLIHAIDMRDGRGDRSSQTFSTIQDAASTRMAGDWEAFMTQRQRSDFRGGFR